MKKIITVIYIFFTILLSNNYAEWYLDDIQNTQNIESSKLLEKHVSKLKNQLELFKNEYYIKEDKKIDDTIKELEIMYDTLNKVITKQVSDELVNNINKTIINKLKNINNDLNPYLKIKINYKNNEASKYKLKYQYQLKKFANQLRNIVSILANKIKKKEVLSEKDEEIIENLRKIESYVSNLENFSRLNFNTKEELKIYMIDNISNIKITMNKIKKLLTSK